ncbi:MAG: hypothetical protein GXO87_09870 [Chlorobi bacterium]|nr:hypothetical protein [Chlorobiota bacterium]
MNTGQMMITIGALMLLTTVILRVNSDFLLSTVQMAESKYELVAVSLGTSLIEEAFSKPFDEITANDSLISSPAALSSNLGPDAGEDTRAQFDDFDDYNNYVEYTAGDTSLLSADFKISSKVFYVDPAVSLDGVATKTYFKRIEVEVTSRFIDNGKDTIRLTKINSHFYFR